MARRMAILAGLALLVTAASPALGQVQVVSAGPERAAVVIYRDRPVDTADLLSRSSRPWERLDREGLALVIETRVVDLPAGEGVIRFKGVATGIVSQSATLDGLPAQVVERNTDFDLLSPGSLLERSVGEVVSVVRTNPVTGQQTTRSAIVRSGPSGPVLEVDGRFEALGCSSLTERIVFDRVPEGLGDQPVLSVRTRAPAAGRYTVTLAYLATGLQWSADYVARVRPDGRSLDLTGWLTLANYGGTGFRDAPVQVVAGTLNRDDGTIPVEPRTVSRARSCWPQDTTTHGVMPPAVTDFVYKEFNGGYGVDEIVVTGTRSRVADFAMAAPLMAVQDELGDYKIYTLPGRTDVNARQTKQVRFLEQDNVRFTRIYQDRVYAGVDEGPHPPRMLLRLRNRERDGLGLPLPGGAVALMETQGGRPLFTGHARFADRGVGLPVELEFGAALDLTVSHSAVREGTNVQGRSRFTVTVTVRNDKPGAAEVEIVPSEADMRGFRIVDSDRPSIVTEAGHPAWRVAVPGRGAVRALRYTIEYGA